jgi:hypothetical protein
MKLTFHIWAIVVTILTETVSAHEEGPRSILHAGRGRIGKTIEKTEELHTNVLTFMLLCTYMLLKNSQKWTKNFITRDEQIVILLTAQPTTVELQYSTFQKSELFNKSSHETPKLGSLYKQHRIWPNQFTEARYRVLIQQQNKSQLYNIY